MIVFLRIVDIDNLKYRLIATADNIEQILKNGYIKTAFMDHFSEIEYDEAIKLFSQDSVIFLKKYIEEYGDFILFESNSEKTYADLVDILENEVPNIFKCYKRNISLTDILQ